MTSRTHSSRRSTNVFSGDELFSDPLPSRFKSKKDYMIYLKNYMKKVAKLLKKHWKKEKGRREVTLQSAEANHHTIHLYSAQAAPAAA